MTQPTQIFDRHAKTALIVVCVLLAGGRLGFSAAVRSLNLYLQKEPVALRSHFDNIATRFEHWEMTRESAKLTVEMVEELGTDLYLDRQYSRTDDRDATALNLHLAYYTGMIDTVPHVPDRCLVAGGFNTRNTPVNIPIELERRGWTLSPTDAGVSASSDSSTDPSTDPSAEPYYQVTYPDTITRVPVTVRMPRGEIKLRTTEFSHPEYPESRMYAGYFFIANGRVAVTPEDVKLIAFRKSEKFAYYCKVQFFGTGDRELTAEDFAAQSADLLEEILPEIMRCLPDWVDVQTGSGTGSAALDS